MVLVANMTDPNIYSFGIAKEGVKYSLAEKQIYNIEVCGLNITVHPQVFSPKYFISAEITNSEFPFIKNQSFLEIGCGVGITSILAAKHNNRVVCTDINPYAVKCTAENAEINQVAHLIDVRESDVFSSISKGETFDTIYWNPPYVFVPEGFQHRNLLEKSVFDPGYKSLEQYIRQAPEFLNEGGRVLICFGSNGDKGKLESITRANQFNLVPLWCREDKTGAKHELFQIVKGS